MSKRVSKTTIFFTALIILIFACIFGFNTFKSMAIKKFLASFSFPASTVTVTKSKEQNWTPFIPSTGTMVASQGVDISPQISGIVVKKAGKSGDRMKKGQLIVALDTSVEQAEYKNALAAEKLAKINYNRDMKLFKQDAISASAVDTDKATLEEKSAQAEQYLAQINLKHIRAPFNGRLGINTANLGQYLTAGTSFTNLQTLSPIYVDYTVPQQDISEIHVGQPLELTVSTYPKVKYHGKILAIDAQVGSDTRSITVRGVLQNTNDAQLLYPGMFATVHTLLPVMNNVITVPFQAITYTLYGNTVYTIENGKNKKTGKAEKLAKLTYVTTGIQQGNEVAITQGLKANETVITQGQVKLSDGAPVKIVSHLKKSVQVSHSKKDSKQKVS